MNAYATVTVSAAMALANLPQTLIYRLIQTGQIKANRITPRGAWRIQRVSLLAWIEQSQGHPSPVVRDDDAEALGLTPDDLVFS